MGLKKTHEIHKGIERNCMNHTEEKLNEHTGENEINELH